MMGLIVPDTGTVRIGGTDLNADNVALERRKMGYVVQDGGLFPHLTARANVTLVARYLGWKESQQEERLGQLAALSQVPEDALDRFPVQLSGGQRQRVSLMRALFLDPDLVLLDEPLAALDPVIRSELQEDLRRIFRSLGKSVVLVTHDLMEAAVFGDQIVLLREGRLIQKGTLRELFQQPADPFVTQFINAQRGPYKEMMRALEGDSP
jgi:osmoprotectant transport system ATP-binding protein